MPWDDTRNGNDQNGNRDIYFTRVRYVSPVSAFGGKKASGISPWAATLLGAAIAVAVGGMIVVIGAQDLRRRTDLADARARLPDRPEAPVP